MSERPFRFGVMAGHVPDVGRLTAIARSAEELGFDTLMTPDPMGPFDPMVALAAVAGATTRLRFGTFVLAVSYRDRRSLAWQADTLNRLSGGRFELGLGIGRPGGEGQAMRLGREYGTPRERMALLTDAVREVRTLTQPPRLLLAGAGPRVLTLAAEVADTVTLTWPPTVAPADVTPVVDRFRSVAGDRADSIELNLNVMAVGDAPAPGIERFIGMSTAELAKLGAVSVLPGDASANARTLLDWRDRWGFSYITVNVDFMQEFASVVERLRN